MINCTTTPLEGHLSGHEALALLPPEQLHHITVSAYIMSGTSGVGVGIWDGVEVIIWDILNNLKCDYKLVSKFTFKITTVVYITSRLSAMGYVLSATIFTTAPIGNCFTFERALGWLLTTAVSSCTLLFLFRVKGVFNGNPYIVLFFVLTWLGVVAGCLTATQGVWGVEIGTTKYCTSAGVAGYSSTAAVMPVVNDTLVFLAISWRLTKNAYLSKGQVKGQLRTLLFGEYLPAFSSALLRDGQCYYLTTISFGLLTVVMVYIKQAPTVYKTMFTIPNIALMNIMACRAFRHTKFGGIGSTEILSTLEVSQEASGDIMFASALSEVRSSDSTAENDGNRRQLASPSHWREAIV